MPFDLQTCARANILQLVPYRCAREYVPQFRFISWHTIPFRSVARQSLPPRPVAEVWGETDVQSDYKDDGTNILLDANENAYGPSIPPSPAAAVERTYHDEENLHRYPDPHQHALKQQFCDLRNDVGSKHPPLTPENLFLGVGSDECIDALLRMFCVPGRDKILTCPPTYGMYAVSAQVNDVAVVHVPLTTTAPGFAVDVDGVCSVLSGPEGARIRLVYLCSPGNPTGALVDPAAVRALLTLEAWNGVVIVDEAYVDFAAVRSSLAPWATQYPNLVVMQTLSKAFGLAGIRLGAAFTSTAIARVLNSLKAPYSISSPTSALAQAALGPAGLAVMRDKVGRLAAERQRLIRELPSIPGVGRFVGGFDANFLLVEMLARPGGGGGGGGDGAGAGAASSSVAQAVYEQLAETRGVVVRFRGREHGCRGCLRITVGTEAENSLLLRRLREVLADVRGTA